MVTGPDLKSGVSSRVGSNPAGRVFLANVISIWYFKIDLFKKIREPGIEPGTLAVLKPRYNQLNHPRMLASPHDVLINT